MARGDFITIHCAMFATSMIAYFITNFFSMNLEYSFLYSYSNNDVSSYILGMFLVFAGAYVARMFGFKEVKQQAVVFNPNLKIYFFSLVLFTLVFSVALLYTSDGILLRYNYQFFDEAGAGIVLSFLELLIAVLPSIILFNAPPSRAFSYFSFGFVFLSCMYLYGTGTKLAVAALVFFIIVQFNKKNKLTISSILMISFILPFLSMILNQRNYGLYGVYTFLEQLKLIFTETADMFSFAFAVFTSSIYIYIETVNVANLNIDDLLIELNPVGGFAAGWYEVADYHRINYAVPFSGFATLYHHSPLLLIIFGFCIQQLMTYFSFYMSALFRKDLRIVSVLLCFYLWNMMASYNLRASMRWLYLLFLVTAFLYLICRIRRRKASA